MGSLATEQTNVPGTDVPEDATQLLGTLAHDLRQPLSNIETIAYYLSMILPPGDAKIQTQLTRIRELVEQSNSILSSALSLPQEPAAQTQPLAPGA